MAEVTGETVNQESTAENVEQEHENRSGTFTQDDVNRIVDNRLQRERAKYAEVKSDLDKANSEKAKLQDQINNMTKANEVKQIRDKVAAETGVPASMLYGDDEETCKEQAQKIMEFARKKTFPQVPDKGEVTHVPSEKTRDKFAEWFDKQMK